MFRAQASQTATVVPGGSVNVTVQGENTGDVPGDFWIGLSFRGPNATQGFIDIPVKKASNVDPGQSFTASWTNLQNGTAIDDYNGADQGGQLFTQKGVYQARVSVWNGHPQDDASRRLADTGLIDAVSVEEQDGEVDGVSFNQVAVIGGASALALAGIAALS